MEGLEPRLADRIAAADDPPALDAFSAFGDDLVKILGAHFGVNRLKFGSVSTVCRANDNVPKSMTVNESGESE